MNRKTAQQHWNEQWTKHTDTKLLAESSHLVYQ